MNLTKIEWVRNPDGTPGYTLNSKTGCLNGCPYCYARKLANGRLKQRYLANHNFPNYLQVGFPHTTKALFDPFYPRFWPERLEAPYKVKKPAGIFLDDMSDWMGDYWPEEWTQQEFQMMKDNPQHRIYTLTKQPQNLPKFSPFPENCWVGVTVDHQNVLWKAAYYLSQIEAKVKFISFEPLLVWNHPGSIIPVEDELKGINWVIIGAQTKPYKPPKIEWVEEIVKACDKADVKVFLKDNLQPLLPKCEPFYKERRWHAGGMWQFRQEMPK